MKRIKKIAVVLLLIITSVFSFGCWKKDDSYQYKFFSQEVLDEHWISDMPTLPYGEDVRCTNGWAYDEFYCSLENNTYMEYVQEFYEYLKGKFKYVGINDADSTWSTPFVEGKELADFITEKESKYGKVMEVIFIYGNEIYQPYASKTDCLNWRGIKIWYYENTQESSKWDNFTYNTEFSLFITIKKYKM